MQALENLESIDSRLLRPLPAKLTYGATIDMYGEEHQITDFMIRRACQEIESQQQFPFCANKQVRAVKV